MVTCISYEDRSHDPLRILFRQCFGHMTKMYIRIYLITKILDHVTSVFGHLTELCEHVTISSCNIPEREMFLTQGLHSTVCYEKGQFSQREQGFFIRETFDQSSEQSRIITEAPSKDFVTFFVKNNFAEIKNYLLKITSCIFYLNSTNCQVDNPGKPIRKQTLQKY